MRRWPVGLHLNRCAAWLYGEDGAPQCGRFLWPWQDTVTVYDQEGPTTYEHHDCHHKSAEALWRGWSRDWRQYAQCEHAVDRG